MFYGEIVYIYPMKINSESITEIQFFDKILDVVFNGASKSIFFSIFSKDALYCRVLLGWVRNIAIDRWTTFILLHTEVLDPFLGSGQSDVVSHLMTRYTDE